jgi:hypothetical protein
VGGALVADLGVGPEVWLFLTLLGCVTIFFKFRRFWSIRNLDLFLLFALAPGMMMLVANAGSPPWIAYFWLFLGTLLWLARCLLDLGLNRRPLLEPNLNLAGLACISAGVLSLFIVETVSLSLAEGSARNPADANTSNRDHSQAPPPPPRPGDAVSIVVKNAPLSTELKADPHKGLARLLACVAQVGLVVGLVAVGWYHFERPIAGLAVATCYLLLPYSRFALADSGQLVPAALIVAAIVFYRKPFVAGPLIGVMAAWMPASLGLIPLWTGFYRGRGWLRFGLVSIGVFAACVLTAKLLPPMNSWFVALGARTMADAGLWPTSDPPPSGSFWSGIDPSYRLPVWIAYLALVAFTTFWPAEKSLGEVIATSAALLVASQFWYLSAGGTLVLLYLPLVILMMFRPNLGRRHAAARRMRPKREASPIGTDA